MPYIKIIRPFNFIFVIITTLFGALYPNFKVFNLQIVFVSISAAFISAAGYVVNDYFDRYIDKINRPERMIPSGKISPYSAYMYSMLLFILGIAFSFSTRKPLCIAMAFLNTAILFFYAKSYKTKFLIGNILVAYAASSTFLYGAFVTYNLKNIFPVVILAFLFTLIREFIKDAQDAEGDKKMGAKTAAIVIGIGRTVFVSLILSITLIFILPLMFFLKIISLKQGLLLILFTNLPTIFVLKDLYKKPTARNFTVVSNFLKIQMMLVLIIFYLGH